MLIVDSETKSVELVLDTQKTTTVVNVVTSTVQVWSSLDGAHGYIQVETLVCQLDSLPIVNHLVFFIFVIRMDHSSKDHDLFAGDLDYSSMDDLKFQVISDVVYSLPDVSFNVKSLHFFHIVKELLISHSGLWLEALSTNNKNVLLIKLTDAKGLSCLLKVW